MTTHIVTSHGADFFGEDRHPLKAVGDLADYARGSLSYAESGPLLALLSEPGSDRTIPAAEAAQLSDLLLRVSRSRGTKPKPSALARALADAAGRAAADEEPWTWTLQEEGQR
ncbi:hypothetical protein ACFU9W_44120 [Streptomyces sp. NPDC057600]|uniref:DUF7739 domain-containing protein n=1 Tax=Streptomyces sp. NPDC057600 TaxID=3346180 RepID=UPI0036CCE77F